jgi:HAD superfamily hydrolase (TIGR01509 family)
VKLGIPPGNYSISKTAPNGHWHRLERGEMVVDAAFYRGFTQDLHDPNRWRDFYLREAAKHPELRLKDSTAVPPVPKIDGEWLFDDIMRASRPMDPWMLPALQNLRASGRYILAALSNTVIFPAGHELADKEDFFEVPIRRLFHVFISSAHVGIRKPDPKMYEFALKTVGEYVDGRGKGEPLQPGDILFLDDIGENLREARQQGFGTIKVPLGRAYEAVHKLEEITGLKLAGDHPKIPIETRIPGPKAKI